MLNHEVDAMLVLLLEHNESIKSMLQYGCSYGVFLVVLVPFAAHPIVSNEGSDAFARLACGNFQCVMRIR